MSDFENNLSKGGVVSQLLRFSAPLMLSNLIQSLYGMVDMVIVGRFSGAVSMSGVNTGSRISIMITHMVAGLAVGATVLVGQYLGADDRRAMRDTIATLFTALGLFAAAITAVMLVLRLPVLNVMRVPAEAFSQASDYYIITMSGTIFVFAYNALSAVMRGMGDSKRPMLFVCIACVANVAGDYVLVALLGMGAAGAAIATIGSQAISVMLSAAYLKRHDFIFDFRLSSFRIDRARLGMILKIGIPTSIQSLTTSVSFLFLTAIVNSMGVTASAAVGAVNNFINLALLPGTSMSAAISAMCAQNLGAGEEKRALRTWGTGTATAFVCCLVVFLFIRAFPELCLSIFSDDPEIIASGVLYLSTFSLDFLLAPVVFCLNGFFIASGHTFISFFNSCISALLARIPAAYLFGVVMGMGLAGVGLAAPAASALSLISGAIFFFSGRWKHSVIIKELPVQDS